MSPEVPALLRRYPGLSERLPWRALGRWPTPARRLERLGPALGLELWLKDDGASAPRYGGNKVRKLEHVLAEAKLLGRKSLLTVGGIGSNQCLATTIHGRAQGFEVDIALFDQPVNEHVVDNLCSDQHFGAHFVYGGGFVRTAYRAVAQYASREAPYYIPAGASLPIGNAGYVTAALELAAQIKAGELPEPDYIYVAAGSCGTAAGLLAGCRLAGLRSKVVAVRITDAIVANAWNIAHNANALMAALRSFAPGMPDETFDAADLILETGFFGGGYGVVTPEGLAAVEAAKPALTLETTYTGKTLAAAVAHARRSSPETNILFWNTFNSAPVAKAAVDELPAEIRAALRENA